MLWRRRTEDPSKPIVYTIAPGIAFVDALAAGICTELGDDPVALTTVKIFLPTRRACRSLTDAFLRRSHGRPLLLPRLIPLGDIDEDDLTFGSSEADALEADFVIPPAISPLRRQLLLTRLVLAYRRGQMTIEQAAGLAAELARLLDQIHTERLDVARLSGLVPEKFARHWQITLDFLAILIDRWPSILAEEGCLDPADRRNRLIEAQAKVWRDSPPETPVIAAGSTGSIPAVADLLTVIAGLPYGAVILPGLDADADDEAWAHLEPCHPQFSMARLLERLGTHRRLVKPWPAPEVTGTSMERAALLCRALAPSATAHAARCRGPISRHAVDGVFRIDAPGPEEEARTIALIMRETLEHDGKTAALVTPDRTLARRVAAELQRWTVAIDDSAGRPLAATPLGTFLRLTARMAVENFAPVPLLAALKHPLAACGIAPVALRAKVRALELAALRGPRPALGLAGLEAAVAGASDDLRQLLEALSNCVAPFLKALEESKAPLRDLLGSHIAMAETMAATDQESGSDRLWAGEAGEAAAAFFADLNRAAEAFPPFDGAAYPALLDVLMRDRVVRPRYGRHPRLAILGLLEARLQHADVMILGSLNEDTWPPTGRASPWMSRPMMKEFGLLPPEHRIGVSAHDFCQLFSAPVVYLTRARRVEGTPTIPCRWLRRLENLVGGTGAEAALKDSGPWLHWQSRLDQPDTFIQTAPPAPKPPVSARPRRLSVTQIETWMRDPYAIYARHILGLTALEPIDADPGAAQYGAFVHKALELFTHENPRALPADALDRLLACGRRAFGNMLDRPGIAAFWWPRFERIARWFIDVERERRPDLQASAGEVKGRLVLNTPAGPFELTAVADRIDTLADGSLVIMDYKTGSSPSKNEVAAGFAPQLPLEAAIAWAGGFEGLPAARVATLEYWRLRGGSVGGERTPVGLDPREMAEQALSGLARLIAVFDDENTPYPARPRPSSAPRFSDYEHLSRMKEWSAGGREDGE